MIVFGHNNFSIKKFSYRDLNLPPGEGWEDISFEVRQRYAHLFWIPFFPIGKLWAIKKRGSGDDLYEMPNEIRRHIEQRFGDEIGTPWYSWSLFLLALLAGLFFGGQELYNDYRWSQASEYSNNEEKMMVEYPTTGDYYKLKYYDEEDSYGRTVYFKVKSYTDDQVVLVSLNEDLNTDEYLYGSELYDKFDRTEYKGYNETSFLKKNLIDSYGGEEKISNELGTLSLQNVERRPLY